MSKTFHEGQLVLTHSLDRYSTTPLVGVYMKAFYAEDGSGEAIHMVYLNDTFKTVKLYRDGDLLPCREGFTVMHHGDCIYHNSKEGVFQEVCSVFAGKDMAGSNSRYRRALMIAELLAKTSQEWRREFFSIKGEAEAEVEVAEDRPDGA